MVVDHEGPGTVDLEELIRQMDKALAETRKILKANEEQGSQLPRVSPEGD